MKEWSKTGIYIAKENKAIIKNTYDSVLLYIFRICALLVAVIGILLITAECFSLKIDLYKVMIGLCLNSVFLGIGWIGRNRWRLVQFAWIGIMIIIAICQWKKLYNGYLIFENAVRNQLDTYYGINLPLKSVDQYQYGCELFLFLILTIFLLVLGNQVVCQGRTFITTIVMSLLVTLELLCGNRYQNIGIYLIAGSVLVLVVMRYRKENYTPKVLSTMGLWTMGILIVLTLISSTFIAPVIYEKAVDVNMKMYYVINQTIDKMTAIANSQNGIFGNHTPTADGSLSNNPVRQDKKNDLIITLTEAPTQNMYLRGFIGDTYEEMYWHRSNKEVFLKEFSQENASYYVQNIFYQYISNNADVEKNTAIIERLDPGGKYGYVPYGFETPNNNNLYGDTYYSSDNSENTFSGYVNWRKWYNSNPSRQALSDLEAQYKEYAINQYLKVPVNGLGRLKSYCEKQNLESVQDAIDFVVADVKSGRTYSMDLEPVPDGKDFAEYFFFEQKEGYCIHFATTATLMFRLLGVPARYVTGYMVTPDAFEQKGDVYVAEVPDTRAHAWVEVYRLGKGWIPLEVTPGYTETTVYHQETNEQEHIPENETPEPTPTAEPVEIEDEQTPLDNIQITETQNTAEKMDTAENKQKEMFIKKIIGVIFKIVLVIVVFLMAMAMINIGVKSYRKSIIRKRKRLFFQKDINKGICEISFALYKMLADAQNRGIMEMFADSRDINDLEYAKLMETNFSCVDDGEYVQYIKLAQKATFGKDILLAEERKDFYSLYRKIGRELWKKMKKKDKLWWKYIKCYEI